MSPINRKWKVLVSIGVLVALAGAAFFAGMNWGRSQTSQALESEEDVAQRACQRRLESLLIVSFSADGGGFYFPSNSDFKKDNWGSGLLLCPGLPTFWEELEKVYDSAEFDSAEIDERSDYIYVDWSNRELKHNWEWTQCPLIYDRRLSNHGGRGINIIYTDSQIMWDPEAYRLRAFAKAHPEAKIPIPSDAPDD